MQEKRKQLADEFEKEWEIQQAEKEDLLGSKLLDSLDLDIGTISREYEVKGLIKEGKQKDK